MKRFLSSARLSRYSPFQILYTMLIFAVVVGSVSMLNNTSTKITAPQTHAATCTTPYDSGTPVQLGQTETNVNNMENRWPISQFRREYDFYSYFVPATIQEAQASGSTGGWPVLADANQYMNYNDTIGGNTDPLVAGMMGKMFGYKPNMLANATFMRYPDQAAAGADTLVKGTNPALSVPINPQDPVMMPDTGYSIGGNMEAMVVFAAEDRLTLHIGRHEYFVGTPNQNLCNGKPCSGGYWIYLRGICVDQQIQNAYNQVQASQNAAGADKNPITLPMIEANRVLGKAIGNSVDVIVRDNGPLISVFKPFYWQGVPAKDFGVVPTPTTGSVAPTTVPGAPTNTPIPGLPTDTPTPTPTATPTFTPTPTPDCGFVAGQRCCTRPPTASEFAVINPSTIGGTRMFCYNHLKALGGINLTCKSVNSSTGNSNICTQTAVAPTFTPTATPTPTPTAFPPPQSATCSTIQAAGNPHHIVVTFLPYGYSGNQFKADARAAIAKFESVTNGPDKSKFQWMAYDSSSIPLDLKDCPVNNTIGAKVCWDQEAARKYALSCGGGDRSVVVILTTTWTWTSIQAQMYINNQVAFQANDTEAFPSVLAYVLAQINFEMSIGPIAPANVGAPYNCSTTAGCGKWDQNIIKGIQCVKGCMYDNWYRATDKSIMHASNELIFNSVHKKMWDDAFANIH